MRPNLFIVGAQKAGTTSLYHYLAAHPEVFMCPLKEPHYFVRHRRGRPQLVPSEAAYLRYFAGVEATYAGEASAHYFTQPESPALIHAFNPDAHILILLRRPDDVLPAFHHEECFVGRERRPFAEALEEYAAWYAAWPGYIRGWQALFGERVQLLWFEELQADAPALYARVLARLGLPAFVPEFSAHNPAKALPPAWRARLSASGPVVAGVRLLYRVPKLALWLDGVRRGRVTVAARPVLDAALRARLLALTEGATRELEILSGRDLSAWRVAA